MSFPGAKHLYLKFDPRCSSQYDYDKVIVYSGDSPSAPRVAEYGGNTHGFGSRSVLGKGWPKDLVKVCQCYYYNYLTFYMYISVHRCCMLQHYIIMSTIFSCEYFVSKIFRAIIFHVKIIFGQTILYRIIANVAIMYFHAFNFHTSQAVRK